MGLMLKNCKVWMLIQIFTMDLFEAFDLLEGNLVKQTWIFDLIKSFDMPKVNLANQTDLNF